LTARSLNSVVYSCFGIFIICLSKSNVNFTSPLEDYFSGEAHLCDSLGLRLADVEPLIARRLRCNAKDALERNLVLAIIDGDTDEYNRLSDVIGRRNSLSLKVISSS